MSDISLARTISLLVASGALVAAAAIGAGNAGGAPEPAQLTLDAPASVDPPRMVWDVVYDSARPSPGADAPAFVREISARLKAPPETDARDVAVTLEAPGVVTPTSPTRFRQLDAGDTVTVSWRWAAPLRAQAPPYDLPLRATATFAAGPQRERVVAGAAVTVSPPPAPTGDAYVSDLPFSWATNGYGTLERDMANGQLEPGDGGPIRLDGRTFEKGLGVNALAIAGFHLGGNCTTFRATVGIDDGRGGAGSVVFRVVGDGRTLFDSGVMRGSTPARDVAVDVTGVRQLDLVTDPTADGQGNDGADWGGAAVECGS